MPASDAQPTPKVKSEAIKFDIASPTGIVYNHITRNAAGNANVGLRYDTSKAPEAIKQGIVGPQIQKVLIQTALFRKATVKEWDNKRYNRPPSWEVQFSLGGHDDEGSEVHAFVEWLKEVDAQTIAVSEARSLEWFKQKHDLTKLESYHTSLIRQNINLDDGTVYTPTLKAPLPFRSAHTMVGTCVSLAFCAAHNLPWCATPWFCHTPCNGQHRPVRTTVQVVALPPVACLPPAACHLDCKSATVRHLSR
jgi:hypothetical protein